MRFSEALVERQGLLCQFLGSRECESAASEAVVSEYAVAIGQARICKGVTGISTYCLFEVFDSPVDLVLDGENVLEVPVIRLGPEVFFALGIDQLDSDSDSILVLSYTPFD